MIVSYRGYGKSTGFPSESGLKIDAQVSLDYLLKQRTGIDRKKIVVFGSSLGGAVAIDLAHSNQEKLHALALENTFTCIPDLVDSVLPALKYFKFLVTNPWHSLTKIKTVSKVPVLFLSGQKDELVPEWMMLRLHDACPAQKKWISFPEGQHVNTFLMPNYYTHLRNFIDELAS
jgi:abhydrolase domain-containing protein 13